jgi:ribonuclease III
VVSRQSCAAVAKELGLGPKLAERGANLPPGELERLVVNRNVLAALLEAALAALFLEHRFEAIEGAIVAAFAPRIEYAATHYVDYKTELQEALARQRRQVMYRVLEVEGPAHEREFTCAAVIDDEHAGVGVGRTKKDAEQAAAREALEKVQEQTADEPSA